MPKEENKKNLNKKTEDALNKYRPIEGPEPWQLKWGLLWVENKMLLRRIFLAILIIIGILSWSYSIYGFGYYAYKGIEADEIIGQGLITIPKISHNFVKSKAAQELVLSSIYIFPSIDNTSDLAVEVRNLNKDWYATLDYFFTVGQRKTAIQHEFILPGEKKYLTEFLYDGSKPTDALLNIINLKWHRISSPDAQKTVAEYLKSNTDISISDIQLVPGESEADKSSANTMIFKAKNNTPYNFWSVDFYFALGSGSRLSGVNKYRIENFFSGEEREAGFSWLGRLSGSKVEVIPSVNIFDIDNYIPFDLGSGQLK